MSPSFSILEASRGFISTNIRVREVRLFDRRVMDLGMIMVQYSTCVSRNGYSSSGTSAGGL